MAESEIDIEQQVTITQGLGLQEEPDKRSEMEAEMMAIISQISIPSSKFGDKECSEVVSKIKQYVEKHERILYTTISNRIFAYQKNDVNSDIVGEIVSNLDFLVKYCYKNNLDSDSNSVGVFRNILKLWDHVNLAQQQYQKLHISDKEYQEKFERQMRIEKEKLYHDINSHMVTMIGIFTALSFVIFGGINSIETAFSGMTDTPLSKLMVIGCIWSFGLLNLVYIFLYCIAKLNNLNFKNNEKVPTNYAQKYHFIVIPNAVIVTLLILSLWIYFVMSNSLLAGVIQFCNAWGIWFTGISTIILAVILLCAWWYILNKLNCKDK